MQTIPLTIEKYAPPGNGLGFYQGKAVFVPQTVVGDEVLVQIEKEKKRYIIGALTEVVKPGPQRCKPLCPHFELCGGCDLLQLHYRDQLDLKKEMLIEVLAGVGIGEMVNIVAAPEPVAYRHRAVFHCHGGSRQIGFLRRRSHEIIAVPDCLVLAPGLKKLTALLAENPELVFRKMTNCYALASRAGDFAAVGGRGRLNERNFKPLKGIPATIDENYGFGEVELAASGFAQVNPQITALIAENLLRHCTNSPEIVELYGGSGTFSLALATVAHRLTVYESDSQAAGRARKNAVRNGFENLKIVSGRVEKSRLPENFDTLVVDPPRVGLSNEVAEVIAACPARKIIYISCNPATLARDLVRLKSHAENLHLNPVTAYDMYPGTTHLEVMAVLDRN